MANKLAIANEAQEDIISDTRARTSSSKKLQTQTSQIDHCTDPPTLTHKWRILGILDSK